MPKEIREEIMIVVPVQVHYYNQGGRDAAIKEITRLHLDVVSSQGYRAKIKRRRWELGSYLQISPIRFINIFCDMAFTTRL